MSDDERVTKPFKFVTGMSDSLLLGYGRAKKKNSQSASYDPVLTLCLQPVCQRSPNVFALSDTATPFRSQRAVSGHTRRRRRYVRLRFFSALLPIWATIVRLLIFPRIRCRCAVSQREPDQALLAELRRLPQVHPGQGRGLCSLPSGMSSPFPWLQTISSCTALLNGSHADRFLVLAGLPVPLPERLGK